MELVTGAEDLVTWHASAGYPRVSSAISEVPCGMYEKNHRIP